MQQAWRRGLYVINTLRRFRQDNFVPQPKHVLIFGKVCFFVISIVFDFFCACCFCVRDCVMTANTVSSQSIFLDEVHRCFLICPYVFYIVLNSKYYMSALFESLDH